MSENQMKDRITEELKQAKETGEVTSEKIYALVKNAVSDAIAEGKYGVEEIRPIGRDALTAAVEELRTAETEAAENIKAALKGTVDGVRSHMDQEIHVVRKKTQDIETKLSAEKAKLAQSVRETLKGAKEAGETFSEETRNQIESASTYIKLESTELLGLTKETVKEAVKNTIDYGKDVKETVTHITSAATEKALKEGRFRKDRVKDIVEKIISGAVEAAEESGKEVKDVALGSFKGVQKGITSAAESIGERTKEFVHEDVTATKKDLGTIEELFIETALQVARRSEETARDVLTDLVKQSEKTTSVLREKAGHSTKKIAEIIKESGKIIKESGKIVKESGKNVSQTTVKSAGKVTSSMAEEAMVLGKKSMNLAKGAISGMLKGAKDGLQKKDN
ncbi:MAG: DUF6781 family protein [Thermodesulfobacteriota bacterium]|nr:DUF6781 family protein [Thermodesulfobacteriota bacterium]